jgi:hypothetical protein
VVRLPARVKVLYRKTSKPTLGASSLFFVGYWELFYTGVKAAGRGTKLTTGLHLMSRLRTNGVTTSFSCMLACCAEEELYLRLHGQ